MSIADDDLALAYQTYREVDDKLTAIGPGAHLDTLAQVAIARAVIGLAYEVRAIRSVLEARGDAKG